MSKAQESVKEELQEAKEGSEKTPEKRSAKSKLDAIVAKIEPWLADALPRELGPKRFSNLVVTVLRKNAELLEADRRSLYGAILRSAQLGLELHTLGQSYLVPFYNKDLGKKEVQLIIGYRGMIDLARRSGDIAKCNARIIYEHDEYDIEYGTEEKIVHRPYWLLGEPEQGKMVAAYLVVQMKDGSQHLEIMPKKELDDHFDKYVQGSIQMSKEDWYKKTVVRRAFRWLPVSTEAKQAYDSDQRVHRFDQKRGGITGEADVDVLEADASYEVEEESGEDVEDETPFDEALEEELEGASPAKLLEELNWKEDKEECRSLIKMAGWEDGVDLRSDHETLVGYVQQKALESRG